MDFTINGPLQISAKLSEGTPVPDYSTFCRDSEIAPTEDVAIRRSLEQKKC